MNPASQKSEVRSQTITPTPLISLGLRHGFAALAGFLVAHGIQTSATNAGEIIAGLLVYGVVCLCSWLAKLNWSLSPAFKSLIEDSGKQMMQKAFASLASNGLALLSGYLATTPQGTFDVNNPEALALFGLNALGSRYKLHHSLAGVPRAALVLALACLLTLPACSTASRDRVKASFESLLTDAGNETSKAALRATIDELQTHLAELEAAPITLDWQSQLIAQGKMVTLRAAIATAKKRLSKLEALDAIDAKQPRNVQPSAERISLSPLLLVSTSPPSAGRPASGPPLSTASSSHLAMPRPAVFLKNYPAEASPRMASPQLRTFELRPISKSPERSNGTPTASRLRPLHGDDEPAVMQEGRRFTLPCYAPRVVASLRARL